MDVDEDYYCSRHSIRDNDDLFQSMMMEESIYIYICIMYIGYESIFNETMRRIINILYLVACSL